MLVRKRSAKVYLVPKKKRKTLGDSIIVWFPRRYLGFLDHVDEETLGNGEVWYTLHYDCMDLDFTLKYLGDMTHPKFPWDKIAQRAQSGLIEISIERALVRKINAYLVRQQRKTGYQKPIQGLLDEGSWWGLGERMTSTPNSLFGLKHLPLEGSSDPTTIVTTGNEVPTILGQIRVPPPKILKGLVAVSHPGELSRRYPGR